MVLYVSHKLIFVAGILCRGLSLPTYLATEYSDMTRGSLDLDQVHTYRVFILLLGVMSSPSYQYFNLSYPLPFVAHVEINRPAKMNAFIQA